MGWIKAYAAVLVIVALVAALAEMLLEGTPYQKYVKVVVGVLLIIAVLTPLSDLTGQELIPPDYSCAAGQEDYEKEYNDALSEQYRITLAEAVETKLQELGVLRCRSTFVINEDESSPDFRRVLSAEVRFSGDGIDEMSVQNAVSELLGTPPEQVTVIRQDVWEADR